MSLAPFELAQYQTREQCTEAIAARLKLIQQMVGRLYPSLLADEIQQLKLRRADVPSARRL
jgi:hypothetical protein